MADMSSAFEVLEGGTPPSRGRRRLLGALVVLAVLVAGAVWVRDRAAERELRQAVELTTRFGLVSSSTSPPGGAVRYFVLVRNDGVRPLAVTAVDSVSAGLRLRMRDAGDRGIDAGREIEIPLSARLTCADGIDAGRARLPAVIGVRREDGGTTTRRVELSPASLVLDVAATLCDVRPELRDHELSGPVLRTR
jgi:hypothetical protein